MRKLDRTILIVEDSAINRDLLRLILHNEYNIIEAENGQEALKILAKEYENISAILLDLEMPIMNGFETLKRIRSNPIYVQIPVIITTGDKDESSESESLLQGANDYIRKPFNPIIIRQRISNTIRLKESSATINTLQRDRLTGLYNRETFLVKAHKLITQQEPNSYYMSCFDIDNFKLINDQYGTDMGDEVLLHVARCLNDIISNCDGICCRVMADKFAILLPVAIAKKNELIENHIKTMNPPCLTHSIKIRIGRYLITDLTLSVNAMYDRASLAEASVKGRYDKYIAEYDESMRNSLIQEQQIITSMNDALKNNEFEPWFQPQYNHVTGALIGAEALVRWRSPSKGLIQPGIFIPVFERNGFIYELDKFMWKKVCILIRKWLDEGRSPVAISANVSRFDLLRVDFFETITGYVEKYQIPLNLFKLEVTESAFANSPDKLIEMVKRLIDYGFTIEIDDFGSGYSSLNTLKDVPATVLKLDMRFLETKGDLQRGGNILESVVRMAKWLGMTVIAEGVELKNQADYLKSIGCYYIQGYLYSKPIPLADYEKLLDNSSTEKKLMTLETVNELNNNAFWDPNSMDTLIFNSYVGGACIFEYHNGIIELLRANDKYAQVIGSAGMTIDDALKLNWTSYLDEENHDKLIKSIYKSIVTKDEVTEEFIFKNLPNCLSKTYLRFTLRVIAKSGDHYLVYCTNENTTAQRLAEQKEHRISQQLNVIMANINGGVTATVFRNNKPILLFANDQYYSQFGYTKEEYHEMNNSIIRLIYPEDVKRVIEEANNLSKEMKSGIIFYRVIRKDKNIRWIQSNISIVNLPEVEEPVQLAVTNDITEQKELEDAEKSALQRIQAIMDNAGTGIVASILDNQQIKLLFSNEIYYKILGYTRKQYEDEVDNIFSLIHPDDIDRVKSFTLNSFQYQQIGRLEYRIIRRDKKIRWVKAVLSFTRFVGIEQTVQLCIFNDITPEKEAEEEIKASDEQIKFLNNMAHKLLAQSDINKGIEEVLWELLAYFQGNRVYVFEIDYNKQEFSNTYEVCSSNVVPEINNLKNIPMHVMDFWLELFNKQDYINIEDVEKIDDSRIYEKNTLLSQNIKSLVAVSIRRNGKLIGFLGVDDPYQKQSSVERLNAIGDYLSVMLTRRDLTTKIINDNIALNGLLHDLPGGFVRMKLCDDGRIIPTFFNPGFFQLVDMTYDELMALYQNDAYAGVYPEDYSIVQNAVNEMITSGETFSMKYRLRHGKEGYTWVMFFGRASKDDNGKTIFNVYYIDATEQKNIEETQKELLDNLPCGAALYEYDKGKISVIHINRRYSELVNRTIGEYKTTSVMDAIHPDDRENVLNELKQGIKEKHNIELKCRIKYGIDEYRIFRVTARVVKRNNETYALYVTYSTISTDDISYQEMLPVVLDAVMKTSNDISFVKDINHRYICCSNSFIKYCNQISCIDLIGKTDYDLLDASIAEHYHLIEDEIIQTGKPRLNYDEIFPMKDGKKQYINTSKYPLFDSEKKVIGIYCICHDITEYKTAFERVNLVANSIPGGIASFEVTSKGIHQIYINDGFYKYSGYTKEEYLRRSQLDPLFLIHPDDKPGIFKALKQLKNVGDRIMDLMYRCKNPVGDYHWFSLKGVVTEKHQDSITIYIVQFDINEEKKALDQLRISEEKYKIAASLGDRIIAHYDIKNKIYYNDSEKYINLGYKPYIENVPQAFIDLDIVASESVNTFLQLYQDINEGKLNSSCIVLLKTPNNDFKWFQIDATTILDEQHQPLEAILVLVDVTLQREKEAIYNKWQLSLKDKDLQTYTLFRCSLNKENEKNVIDGALIDKSLINNELSFDEITNQYANNSVYIEDRQAYIESLKTDTLIVNYYRGERVTTFEYREVDKKGNMRWILRTVELIEYIDETDLIAYIMFENINESKIKDLQTKALAENDPLTGILNRATFKSLVEERIKNIFPKGQHILMMMDIDGFKLVNDVFGHAVGDKVLIEVAESMSSVLRHDDLLGRLGGDEFMMFMSDVPNDSIAAKRAQDICAIVHKSLSLEVQISASIGIVACPRDGDDFDTLYKKADAALYHVKGSGKDNFVFYYEDMDNEHLELEQNVISTNELRRRMLIVDDNQIDYSVLENIFKDEFIIDRANDGNSALIRLRHYGNAISVVLLDLIMPGMNGYDVLLKMQNSVEMQNIPVIVVSGDDDQTAVLKAIKLGAIDFITKPVDADLIKIRVSSAISKAENERLKLRNRVLEIQNNEINKYQIILDHTNTTVIEYSLTRNEFQYDLSISKYLTGLWNHRQLWDILRIDKVCDSLTIKKWQQTFDRLINNDTTYENNIKISLLTPGNKKHLFLINLYKSLNEYNLIDRIIMTINDLDYYD